MCVCVCICVCVCVCVKERGVHLLIRLALPDRPRGWGQRQNLTRPRVGPLTSEMGHYRDMFKETSPSGDIQHRLKGTSRKGRKGLLERAQRDNWKGLEMNLRGRTVERALRNRSAFVSPEPLGAAFSCPRNRVNARGTGLRPEVQGLQCFPARGTEFRG